jgi:hypothetical protein
VCAGAVERRCSRLLQRSHRKAPPRASTWSADGPEHHPPTVRILLLLLLLLLSRRDRGTGSDPRCRRSRVVLGPIATPGTPSRLADELRVSTTTTTTARTTTTIVGAGGATTAMTTASVVGHRTSGVHELLAGASVTRSSPRASRPRPTYRDTTGTPTPVCGSRTTGSCATPVG